MYKKYTIKTLRDFTQVPVDRRADCLAEFLTFLSIVDLWGVVTEGVCDSESHFEWIDDEKKNVEIAVETPHRRK